MVKYIYVHLEEVIILCGKRNDIAYQVVKNGTCKIALYDIPRTHMDYVSYEAIEMVKNGLVTTGKYEGGTICFNTPHVICFANAPPDVEKLSKDRWAIWKIENGHLLRTDIPNIQTINDVHLL